MTILVVAEKPSVARDIAHVLGARTRAEGYFRGEAHVVTWAIGHLVALAEPHEMDPAWKRWSLRDLPLVPPRWPLVVVEKTRAQFEVVRRLLVAAEVQSVVCATDAGREGELIFRYIYEAARANKPVRRLWISSLTPDAIADGFRKLQDGNAFDRLADAARARSRADWLVGMNLSRMYSIVHDDNLRSGACKRRHSRWSSRASSRFARSCPTTTSRSSRRSSRPRANRSRIRERGRGQARG